MYFTDRGLDELEDLRADDEVAVEWLVARMREFIDLHPEYEAAVDRLAGVEPIDVLGEELLDPLRVDGRGAVDSRLAAPVGDVGGDGARERRRQLLARRGQASGPRLARPE